MRIYDREFYHKVKGDNDHGEQKKIQKIDEIIVSGYNACWSIGRLRQQQQRER